MTDNASLDTFADAEEREVDESTTESAVEPAQPTYVFSTEEMTCSNCGEATTNRWQNDGEFVCESCKQW